MPSTGAIFSPMLNPKTPAYQFLGPYGALFISLGVPAMMYGLYYVCSEQDGCPPNTTIDSVFDRALTALSNLNWWKGLWDTEATILYCAWYAFCVLSWVILPGETIEGLPMRTGEKKRYKINACSTFLLAMALAFGVVYIWGPGTFTVIYEKWLGLTTAAILMSFVQAVYVYAMSFEKGKLLALGGNSGNPIYDWFIGRELNPSIGSLDIKYFNELRPGLILWVLVDIGMACEQAARRGGGLANVTDSMWLVVIFQAWYVADSLYHEPAILTTMDITTDGFGFMLSIAVPWEAFTYSLQSRYLVFRQVELGPVWTAIIFGVNLVGYYIFRRANDEKNEFRNGRTSQNLKSMTTASGSKLLTSGLWGLSRHPNYLGDLIMALAWSLPTGTDTLITYFYFFYILILLVHRQSRDDDHCRKKYGKDWDAYKKLVPYRIAPYIY